MVQSNSTPEVTGNTKYIDYLDEDEVISNQKWVCVSFLSPEGIKNCTLRGLKVRGVYGTRAEADQRAKDLQAIDPDFDVFVGEMGKWLPWDPDPNDEDKVKDQHYQEQQLNELMKGYKENLSKAKRHQEQRKRDMIEKAAFEEQNKAQQQPENKTRDRLRRKLEARRKKQNKQIVQTTPDPNSQLIDFDQQEAELKAVEEASKREKQSLVEKKGELNQRKSELESIDDKLSKIQALYNKMKKA